MLLFWHCVYLIDYWFSSSFATLQSSNNMLRCYSFDLIRKLVGAWFGNILNLTFNYIITKFFIIWYPYNKAKYLLTPLPEMQEICKICWGRVLALSQIFLHHMIVVQNCTIFEVEHFFLNGVYLIKSLIFVRKKMKIQDCYYIVYI